MKSSIELMAEILPSLRAEIAKELINIHKMNQIEVSRILGVSQPAVSQYVRQLRGRRIAYDNEVRNEIKLLCEKLLNGRTINLESEIYGICKNVTEKAVA